MVKVKIQPSLWENRRVFITGHTGFVGSWLALCLRELGAIVIGYSQNIPTKPSLFEVTSLRNSIESIKADICDFETLFSAISFNAITVFLSFSESTLGFSPEFSCTALSFAI